MGMSGGKVQMKRSYAVAIVAALITSFVIASPASAEKKPKVAKKASQVGKTLSICSQLALSAISQ